MIKIILRSCECQCSYIPQLLKFWETSDVVMYNGLLPGTLKQECILGNRCGCGGLTAPLALKLIYTSSPEQLEANTVRQVGTTHLAKPTWRTFTSRTVASFWELFYYCSQLLQSQWETRRLLFCKINPFIKLRSSHLIVCVKDVCSCDVADQALPVYRFQPYRSMC